ncbi:MAG TPA: hypothetical protein VK356_12540, partial [Thermomicrobiales bacterium]|nr:hypothetical protein [Thermomicrobiales bacterium]
ASRLGLCAAPNSVAIRLVPLYPCESQALALEPCEVTAVAADRVGVLLEGLAQPGAHDVPAVEQVMLVVLVDDRSDGAVILCLAFSLVRRAARSRALVWA